MNTMASLGLRVSLVLSVLAGGAAAALAASPNTPTAGAAARPVHSTRALPAALRPVLYQALAKDAGATYNINNHGCVMLPRQSLEACFDNHGAHFSGAGSPLALRLVSYGRGGDLATVTAVQPVITANEATYRHRAINEWWRALPIGFEQGFTIAKRPSGNGELTLALAATRQVVGAPPIRHSRVGGNPAKNTLAWGKLRYGELVVTDAKGKVVPATLTTKGDRILIAVNDARAVYPLTVDPLVWLEQKVTASDGAAWDGFGYSVALAPNATTALVGATQFNSNGPGAAYVFSESNGTWSQTAKLTASDGAAEDEFGRSVALAGATALVGADAAPINGNYAQGAVYVFNKSGGNWTQTQKLIASDGAAYDRFGTSVALSGTIALVGANNATIGGSPGQGAAYVFSESGGNWTQTQKLTASDAVGSDYFGTSVAVSGMTALVGAFGHNSEEGAAYVFSETGGSWTQTAELAANDGAAGDLFGISVALSGTTALIGAGNATIGGNIGQGAVYVFGKPLGLWVQTQKLTASDGAANDAFGYSVALAPNATTALVGASDVDFDRGAAYVFGESGGNWTQTQKLTASDRLANYDFGLSVAVSGATAFIGSPGVYVNGNPAQGAAYFYGLGDLSLAVSAPATVNQGQNYVSQAIATNNASAASPAVSATVTVPAAASFISATASQGSCSETSGVVTCDFGPISGSGGTATANVTLRATGAPGTTIENTASVALATPPLTAGLPTLITCPATYTEYFGTLAPSAWFHTPSYAAPGGMENAILTAPSGFGLYVHLNVLSDGIFNHHFLVPAVHQWGPAGTYLWGVKANAAGGAYTLCILHP